MKKKIKHSLFLLALGLLPASIWGLQINEVRIDMPGTDTDEYAELKGAPNESLDGVWYIVIGDHSGSNASKGSGVVEFAIDLTGLHLRDNGLFLLTSPTFTLAADKIDLETTLIFENSDNVTHMLVRGYTGTEVTVQSDQEGDKAVDIDTNDDGLVDNTPWASIVDAVGVVETPNDGEYFYGAQLGFVDVGPDDVFAPGHIYRGGDDNKWYIGTFSLDPVDNPLDSPGSENPNAPIGVTLPEIIDLYPVYGQAGSVITLTGKNFTGVTSASLGGVACTYSVTSDTSMNVTVPEGSSEGVMAVTNDSGSGESTLTFDVVAADQTVLFSEHFDGTTLGQFSAYSVSSDKDWTPKLFGSQTYVEANGYGGDSASDDWLISPAISLSNLENASLAFISARNFTGADIEVKVSTDYDSGNPSSASWDNLVAVLSSGSYQFTQSGAISLASYLGHTIHFAIRYTSLGGASGEGATWQVDEFRVIGKTTSAGPVSLFKDYPDYNGIKDTPYGYIWDAVTPFGWHFGLSAWIYIPEPADEMNGWFFYLFGEDYWCWTKKDYAPYYYKFDPDGAGYATFP